MYKVMIDGNVKELEAAAVSIEGGNLLFYGDAQKQMIMTVVPKGAWQLFEVGEESHALQKQQAESVSEEEQAEGGEEVSEACQVCEAGYEEAHAEEEQDKEGS